MSSSHTNRQKDSLNLIRLINRLERLSDQNFQLMTKQNSSEKPNETAERDPSQWYWELKSLQTTIHHAKTILDTLDSHSFGSQIIPYQNPAILKSKLKNVQDRIEAALLACPTPKPRSSTPPPLYTIKPPELPPVPVYVPKPVEEWHETNEIIDKTIKPTSETEKKKSTSTSFSNSLLKFHNSTQEELTDELSQMASQLKKNVHHFNKLLAQDQAVIQANQTKLELNSVAMNKQGGRLGEVSLQSRKMTWFTIMAVVAVAVAWIMMFIIIRLT